jgi:PKD repeat protein
VSDSGSADTVTLAWAVTKNGSAYASGSSTNLSFTPNDNGTYVVSLTATDDDGGVGSDSRTIAVTNVAPNIQPISGPSAAQQGAPQTFTSAFTDPGSADTWTVIWNFGDGTTLTSAGAPGAITAGHTYVAAGTYTVSVTVTDDDGGSASQSSSIAISNSNTGVLQISGTAGNDDISIKPGCDGTLIVTVNGTQTTRSGITQIVITAGAGNDKIKINPEVGQSSIVFGGDGDDSIKTGAGDDIVIGGNGDDLLHGNDGRDLIIGGWGSDRIVGNSESDILVAGYSRFDADPAALGAILSEWTSARSYGQRTANVMGRDVIVNGVRYVFAGSRNNGNTFLAPDGADATVFDDGNIDILTGNAAQDLFLFNSDCAVPDVLTGLAANELALDIDFLSEP